jgi:type II pantothenate kinase
MRVQAAIDFGISNTDSVALVGGEWRRWTQPTTGDPSPDTVAAILRRGGIVLGDLPVLAVTGGRHRLLPAQIGGTRLVSVNEVPAIGRGGQAAVPQISRRKRILVISAGSGTAAITAQGKLYHHATGTAVGGGTLLGLGRLLIDSVDPVEIDGLAVRGNSNAVDLSLADVITGPIGSLPATATAVNFGRLAREPLDARREDLSAAIVNLVGQVISLLSISASKANRCHAIVIIGHMTDMASIRGVVGLVSQYYSTPIELPEYGGYYTAVGALHYAAENPV